MTERKLILSDDSVEDMRDIASFIVSVSRPQHAMRYIDEVLAELNTLCCMATMLPESRYYYPKRFHPESKMMTLHKKPLCAIFHIEGESVVVDRIVHPSMILY